MSDITITITALNDLITAVNQLTAALSAEFANNNVAQGVPTPMPPQQASQQMLPQQPIPVPQMPLPAHQMQQQQVPMQAPVPGQVPTTAVPQKFTQDVLAVAASGLVNQGKQARLIEILHGFGVNTLIDLPEAQYGAFAGALRMEGAVING